MNERIMGSVIVVVGCADAAAVAKENRLDLVFTMKTVFLSIYLAIYMYWLYTYTEPFIDTVILL